MSYDKQDEKQAEKDMQKHEEKDDQDLLNSVVGAAILIWAGVLLLANNLGFLNVFTDLLEQLPIRRSFLPFDLPFISLEGLQVFFLGAGVILLAEFLLRLLLPAYRRRTFGPLIGMVVFFSLGLGSWELVGPLVLIAIGLSVLVGGFFRRR
jgi:hypothetical protein